MPHLDLLRHMVSQNILDLVYRSELEVIVLKLEVKSHPSDDFRITLLTIPSNSIEPKFKCYKP